LQVENQAEHCVFTLHLDADSGTIGGSRSLEFHILSPKGEDKLMTCNTCHSVGNIERANSFMDDKIEGKLDVYNAITRS
jgi:prolyl-tRNA synthetase